MIRATIRIAIALAATTGVAQGQSAVDLVSRAKVSYQQLDYEASATLLRRALIHHDSLAETSRAEGYGYLAASEHYRGRSSAAREAFRQALWADPKFRPDSLVFRASADGSVARPGPTEAWISGYRPPASATCRRRCAAAGVARPPSPSERHCFLSGCAVHIGSTWYELDQVISEKWSKDSDWVSDWGTSPRKPCNLGHFSRVNRHKLVRSPQSECSGLDS